MSDLPLFAVRVVGVVLGNHGSQPIHNLIFGHIRHANLFLPRLGLLRQGSFGLTNAIRLVGILLVSNIQRLNRLYRRRKFGRWRALSVLPFGTTIRLIPWVIGRVTRAWRSLTVIWPRSRRARSSVAIGIRRRRGCGTLGRQWRATWLARCCTGSGGRRTAWFVAVVHRRIGSAIASQLLFGQRGSSLGQGRIVRLLITSLLLIAVLATAFLFHAPTFLVGHLFHSLGLLLVLQCTIGLPGLRGRGMQGVTAREG